MLLLTNKRGGKLVEFMELAVLMNETMIYILVANVFLISVLLLVCKYAKGKTFESAEQAVFLTLAKFTPLSFISIHLYFILFAVPLFLQSVPFGFYSSWLLGNAIIILLWIYLKFHFFRPIVVIYRKTTLVP